MKFRPIANKEVNDFLSCEQLELFGFIRSLSSPLNILFPNTLLENVSAFSDVFSKNKTDGKIFYACKANKAQSILDACSYSDAGIEASSIFELRNALSHGFNGHDIIISGPSKTKSFLCLGIKQRCYISIDDVSELNLIIEIISEFKLPAPRIILRINDIGTKKSRFGVLISDLDQIFRLMKDNSIDLKGFSFHLSSYLIKDRVLAIEKLIPRIDVARSHGFTCNILDIGGGFPINYINAQDWKKFCSNDKKIKSSLNQCFNNYYPYYNEYPKESCLDTVLNSEINNRTIKDILREKNIILFIEPGRSLLDQAGITIVRIGQIKKLNAKKNIIQVESNINSLSEQWFNSEFLVDPILIKQCSRPKIKFKGMVGGNLCLENDMVCWREVEFQSIPEPGDLLVFVNTAGYQMDSNESNFHLLPLPNKIACYKNNNGWNWVQDDVFTYAERSK